MWHPPQVSTACRAPQVAASGSSGRENQVLPVTVGAGWAIGDASLKGPPVNGPIILKLNVRMTLAAGGGHVDGVDAGIGVGSPLQVMDAMAIGAGSRRGHTLGGSLSVDGQSVLLERLGQADQLVGEKSGLSVAFGAGVGEPDLMGG